MKQPDRSLASNNIGWLLLEYLSTNPNAKDTAEGVAQWWLRQSGVDVHQASVEAALHDLVSSGWLTVRSSMSGDRTYGLNQIRKSELQRLLEANK